MHVLGRALQIHYRFISHGGIVLLQRLEQKKDILSKADLRMRKALQIVSLILILRYHSNLL